MSTILQLAARIERLLREAAHGARDAQDLLAPLGEFTSRALGVGGEVAGTPVYDPDGWSWWTWGWRMRALVRDWVAAGKPVDPLELWRLKKQARPLFEAARAASECLV